MKKGIQRPLFNSGRLVEMQRLRRLFKSAHKSTPARVRNAILVLEDSREVNYEIRSSSRAKYVRLRIDPRKGLSVTAPSHMDSDEVSKFVEQKRAWIQVKLAQFECLITAEEELEPVQKITFSALDETWEIVYEEANTNKVRTRTLSSGNLLLIGNIKTRSWCHEALRIFLMNRAKKVLCPWLETLAAQTGFHYSKVIIRNQKSRWGSCSSRGAISLNCKLLFFPAKWVRYVLLHELCHLKEPNHSHRFWSLLEKFEPDSSAIRQEMKAAWKMIPAWAFDR